MSQITDPIEKDISKGVSHIWGKLPRGIKYPLGAIICFLVVVALFAGGYNQVVLAFSTIFPNTETTEKIEGNEYSTAFSKKDLEQWFGQEYLHISGSEHNIVQPQISNNFLGGREVFSPMKVTPAFITSLSFVPQNRDKINLSINYGYIWRLIIGNGDYNQIVMQKNIHPNKQNLSKDDWINIPEKNGGMWFQRNGRLDPNKEIEVDIVAKPRKESSIIHINVTVSAYINGEIKKQDFDFDYNVDTSGEVDSMSERIGIGFLDPYHEDIQTKLLEFHVQELN